MAFAFNPDDGPARLFRYKSPSEMPGENLLVMYDHTQNLLVINREEFMKLSEFDRKQILRTQRPEIAIGEYRIVETDDRPLARAA